MHSKGYCAYILVHANTIVITETGDTIRVDGPCYTENTQPSDLVLISPYKSDGNNAIADLKYDNLVLKTCYGIISKIR